MGGRTLAVGGRLDDSREQGMSCRWTQRETDGLGGRGARKTRLQLPRGTSI